MRKLRLILWLLVAVAAVGLAALVFTRPSSEPAETVGARSFGGPFTLTGADGKPFPSSRLDGRPHAIFFGFTHCPDVCPTTLARMVRLRRQLNDGERPFEILFVTVDPERDGPAEVGKYAELFGESVIGLTGSPAQIERVKTLYGIYSAKVPDGSGGYTVDHSAAVLLFDEKGDFVATISPEEPDEAALAKLRRISG